MADPPLPTVYVVDDDDAVRDSLKILLESYGLAVRDFGSVPDFLDALEPSGAACLVLDLHLPVMGGFDVMTTLAQRGSRLPVIVITGRGDAQTKARALQAGAVAFLEKPVDDKSLMGAIRTALTPSYSSTPSSDTSAAPGGTPRRRSSRFPSRG